jgi:[acyl-carrier-protein] S-malonyltransferase
LSTATHHFGIVAAHRPRRRSDVVPKGFAMPATTARPRPIALLFPGQGAQHARMAAGLYGHADVFTDCMDTAFGHLGDIGTDLREDWLSDGSPELFDDVTRAQPLLYAVDYALGRLVLSWGVEPGALLGHSVGEMAAATLAGVLDFADGLRLMRDRIEVFADTPPGGMLAVAASAADVEPYLSGEVAVAAVNAPRQLLLAGAAGPLAEVERRLRDDDIVCRAARARQAFHSPVVADAVRRSAPAWERTALHAPERTLYSAYRESVLSPGDARDPAFWARQPVDPVLFGPTLDRLLDDGDFLLVEAGPGQGLSTLARRHPAVASGRSAVVPLLPARPGDGAGDRQAVREAVEHITAEGHDLRRNDFS